MKSKKKWQGFRKFLIDFTSDLQIIIGALLIVVATFLLFGWGISLYTLGGFLLIAGIVGRYFDN